MPRKFPFIPPMQITTGRVDVIPFRYEKVAEFAQDLTIASGQTGATGTISLPSDATSSEIKSVRVFCTGYTFTFSINDSSGLPVYVFENATDALVDNGLAVPVSGNLSIKVQTTSGVTTTTTVNTRVGVRYVREIV